MARLPLTERQRHVAKLLGQAVATLRKRRGMTQQSLARSAHVDIDALRGLERGKFAGPSFFTVMRIAHSLRMTKRQLDALSDVERKQP